MTAVSPVERLQELVRIATVSRLDESRTDWAAFERFIQTIERLYPLVHARLDRERVAGHSLVFRWAGATSEAPTVLMAHYDVVPATDEGWEHPPFGAELVGAGDEQLIWGRGTLDDKGALTAILEAVESQLELDHVPEGDIYLCFGHNEETTGAGANAIVDLLESRGIRPALVLDEGGAVVEGVFPGVSAPIAAVGVSEKGTTTVTLTVEQEGGHASTPPRLTATARLARAIVRLNSRPFPARFTSTNLEMLRTLGSHASGPIGFALSNLWLTKPLLLRVFDRLGDETRAMTRTTQAVTMLSASDAENALAERAVAVVNLRVAVGSSVREAVAHIQRAIRDDKVRIAVTRPNEPAPVSPTDSEGWRVLARTIEATFAGVIVAPYVQLGASDSRHFTRIATNVYRFTPFELTSDERKTLHAMNERMHVATFLRGIDFYSRLIQQL